MKIFYERHDSAAVACRQQFNTVSEKDFPPTFRNEWIMHALWNAVATRPYATIRASVIYYKLLQSISIYFLKTKCSGSMNLLIWTVYFLFNLLLSSVAKLSKHCFHYKFYDMLHMYHISINWIYLHRLKVAYNKFHYHIFTVNAENKTLYDYPNTCLGL